MKTNTKQLTIVALFLALCIVVPILFHSFGAGTMFLPMLIPILLSGFLIRFPVAIAVGFLGPYISALATGMPPLFPSAFMLSIQGIVAAGITSYFFHVKKSNFWICLISAIIAERLTRVLLIFILVPLLQLSPKVFSIADVLFSFPGVIAQLILIPITYKSLVRLKIIQR